MPFWSIFSTDFTVVKLAIVFAWPLCFALGITYLVLDPPLNTVLGGFALAGLIASVVLVVVHTAEAVAMQSFAACAPPAGHSEWPRKQVLLVLAFGAFHLYPALKRRDEAARLQKTNV
jgi:uncharacterized protein YhhL (DUF1145 family)